MDRIQRRWDRVKEYVDRCPNCNGQRIGLNRILTSPWNRYYLECDRCYWCGARAMTIRGAIKKWNERCS